MHKIEGMNVGNNNKNANHYMSFLKQYWKAFTVYYPAMLCNARTPARLVIDCDKIMNMRIIIERIPDGFMRRVYT
jgi:hypothetical protein